MRSLLLVAVLGAVTACAHRQQAPAPTIIVIPAPPPQATCCFKGDCTPGTCELDPFQQHTDI